jgi:uncharacterized membrane protein
MNDGGTMFLLAGAIGVVAGLRTMMAPAAVAWAARAGWLSLGGTSLGWLGGSIAPLVLSALALGELVTDQLPTTPSRKVPIQFGARLASGALSGGAVGLSGGAPWLGVIAGILGAVVGTFGGAALRARLAASFGSDRPAAFLEDAVAIAGAWVIVAALR